MRISINSGILGFGGVNSFQSSLDVLHFSIEDTITDLRSLSTKLANANDEGNHLGEAINSINRRINAEESKKANLETVSSKFNNFLNNAIDKDELVAKYVVQEQKKFYEKYPGLRVQDINTEPSFWEQLSNTWDKLWDKATDWVSDLVTNIVDWMKEHAVELIIGIVCIVAAAAIIYFSGGAFIAALVSLLKKVIIEALVEGIISGIFSLLEGKGFWQSFGDGFARGFMFGGIFQFGAVAIKETVKAMRKVIEKINIKRNFIKEYPDIYKHHHGEIVTNRRGNRVAQGGHFNFKKKNFDIINVNDGYIRGNGVYEAEIRIYDDVEKIYKHKMSSLFPDEWSETKYYKKMTEAINKGYELIEGKPMPSNAAVIFELVDDDNVFKVKVCFDRITRKVTNVFPWTRG